MKQQQQQLQSQGSENLPICPSFNSYSVDGFADIASKITNEYNSPHRLNVEDDFEFSLVQSDGNLTTDELLQNQEVYPIFNRDLLPNRPSDEKTDSETLLVPFEKLLIENREEAASSSDSEDDGGANSPGKFCVWMPQVVPASPSRCKKSNSTGSESKSSWKLRDLLLNRSNSEGKGKRNFVLLTPKKKERKTEKVQSFKQQHEFYVQNRPSKEMQRRKSFLPYRQDLVGLFANMNGFGKSF